MSGQSKLSFDGGWEYAPAPQDTGHIQLDDQYGLFINGKFVEPESGNKAPEEAPKKFDPEALAARLNSVSRSIGRDLRFKVDMNSGNSVIQVLDRDTGEIIREIPPEKAELSLSVNGDVKMRLYNGRA